MGNTGVGTNNGAFKIPCGTFVLGVIASDGMGSKSKYRCPTHSWWHPMAEATNATEGNKHHD